MAEIKNKFMKIMEMRIMITIEGLNYKEDIILESEGFLSIPKNIRAAVDLFNDFMLEEEEFRSFLDMNPSWVTEMAGKFSKSKGKERKIKVFNSLRAMH